MRNLIATMVLAAALAGCAAQQVVSLLPRAPATERGTGTLDRIKNELTVTVGGNTYNGRSVLQTGATITSFGLWSRTSTHYSNQSTALLVGDAGQIRCEFGWDSMSIEATGVCVDSRNFTYDILIRNP